MPSSTSRNTHLERNIFKLFRQTHTCLYHANADQPNRILLQYFAEVLDISSSGLLAKYVRPHYDSSVQTLEEFADENRSWQDFKNKVMQLKDRTNVAGAAECLHSVGTALAVVGRYGDAAHWWNLSDELKDWNQF